MKKKFLFLFLSVLCFSSVHAQYYLFQEAYDVEKDNVEQEDQRIIGTDVTNKKEAQLKKSGVVCYVQDDDSYKTGIYAEGNCKIGKQKNASFKRVVLLEPKDLVNAFEKCEEWHQQVSKLVEASGMSKTFTKEIATVGGYSAYVTSQDKIVVDSPKECTIRLYFVEESLCNISSNYGLKIVASERSQGINAQFSFINYAINSGDFQKEYRTAFTAMNKMIGKKFPSDGFIAHAKAAAAQNAKKASELEAAQNKLRNIEDLLQ